VTRKRKRIETVSSFGRMPARQTGQPGPVAPRPPAPRAPTPPPIAPAPAAPTGLLDAPARPTWRGHVRAAFTDNLGFKLLAVILAVTLFLLVNTDRDREIMARVGVSYSLPDDKVLVSERIDEIRITVRGPWRRLRRFDEREIDRVNLDLGAAAAAGRGGGEVAITADMIRLPPGLTLTGWTPKTVAVAFEERVEKEVEVSPMVVGRPLHGFVVSEIAADPKTVRVRGAAGELADLAMIRTSEIRVDGRSSTVQAVVGLNPPDGVEVMTARPVRVELQLEELLVTRRVPAVAVVLAGDSVSSDALIAEPATVEVVLSGSMRAVEAAQAMLGADVVPRVRVAAGDLARRHSAPVTLEGLPAGVGVEIVPPRVQVGPRK
jgi:YbbR domain-containing protein